jgi:hypothetical protein
VSRTPFDIADIIRRHREALGRSQPLSSVQARALSAITLCRTAALGGHANFCSDCGWREDPSYNSCRNRNCPKCQALAQEHWLATRSEAILPIPHYHSVFTLPEDCRSVGQQHPRELYGALLQSASEALLELARSRLGVTLGLTLVLHTWTRDLRFHPHVHILVSSGGLTLDGSGFKHLPQKYLLPRKPLAALFQGKMMTALRKLQSEGKLSMSAGAFGTLMASLASQDWNVYLKRAFQSPGFVLAYLGRYTHRVGIANSRLLNVTDEAVTFRTKDGRAVTLTPVAFLRRFIQHILPDRFKKIRHTGLYGSPKALAAAKRHLGTIQAQTKQPPTWEEALAALTGKDVTRCANCGSSLCRILIPPIARFPRRSGHHRPRSPP